MSNRLAAIKVTENTLPLITVLNELAPDEECLANPTYFIYPLDDSEGHCDLVSETTFLRSYKVDDNTDSILLVTRQL